jgi:uncharacterized protein
MSAVADTGFVVALAIVTEPYHEKCLSIYREQGEIYLPQTTLAEVAYLLTREGGNRKVVQFLNGIAQTRYLIVPLEPVDFVRIGELLTQYEDARLDFVDTTVIAVAERLKISRILTLDRRDFDIVRPRHVPTFEVLP